MSDDGCYEQMKESCERIRDRLTDFYNGLLYDTETGEMVDTNDLPSDFDDERYIGVHRYLEDNLGISINKFIGDDDTNFRWCCVVMAIGGPGIYIDTGDGAVQGRWWGTNCDIPLSKDICDMVEDAVRDMIY